MKENYRKVVVLALFALALSGAALAQDFSPKVRADIPFNFYAGGKVLPAGRYTIAVNRENNHLALVQKDTGTGMFLTGSVNDGSRNGRSFLIFRADSEGIYVLQQVEGPDLGFNIVGSKTHSVVALHGPDNNSEVVEVALGN